MEQWWNNETFMPDNKWILNKKEEEGDNSPVSQFAELNAAVLEIIHNEKRFPTKEEISQLKFVLEPLIENLWGDLDIKLSGTSDWNDEYVTTWDGASGASPAVTFTDDPDIGIFSSSCDTVTFVSGGATTGIFHLNGLSAVDFDPLPPSALLSTKGCNKYNTTEKFLNEIKNYE